MQKASYYRTVYQRRNVIADALLNFFLGLSSYPRMLLETLIRRNFGERYFSFSGAVWLTILLGLIPFFLLGAMTPFYSGMSREVFMSHFLTWYGYLGAFLYMAWQRHEEIKRLPSVFDFARFSKSTGMIHPQFREFEFNGHRFDVRTVETVIEPGFFFLIGLVFWMASQPIGFVLVISSLFYSFSYVAAYREGDHWLMDKIDERIVNEELVRTFTDEPGREGNRGFHYYGRRPADPDARRQLADMFMEEETVEAR